jgi:hypothetical protein
MLYGIAHHHEQLARCMHRQCDGRHWTVAPGGTACVVQLQGALLTMRQKPA